jgi:hypothetical protein
MEQDLNPEPKKEENKNAVPLRNWIGIALQRRQIEILWRN